MKHSKVIAPLLLTVVLAGCNWSTAEPTTEAQTAAQEHIVYEDETQNEIIFGGLSLAAPYQYHLLSATFDETGGIFECAPNGDWGTSKDSVIIDVKKINGLPFEPTDSVTFLSGKMSAFTRLRIYEGVTNESGITDLYYVSRDDAKAYYYAYCGGQWYEVSANADAAEIWFKYPRPEPRFSIFKYGNVTETETLDNDTKITAYNISRDNGEILYTATFVSGEKYSYDATFRNANDIVIKEFSGAAAYIPELIQFIDLNTDGYIDFSIVSEAGALNSNHDLYLWNAENASFTSVKCDEMLSYFEVYDGYILNRQKSDADSGTVQKLVWSGNTLVLESSNEYLADGSTVVPTIDTEYEAVLECIYDYVWRDAAGRILAEKGGKTFALDIDGTLALVTQYKAPDEYSDGLAIVERDGKLGYIDTDGNQVINSQYDFALPFSDGVAAVGVDAEDSDEIDEYIFIDKRGNTVLGPYKYMGAELFVRNFAYMSFSEGYTAFFDEDAEAFGYMNKLGEITVPAIFERVRPFAEGVAVVTFKASHESAYINSEGDRLFSGAGSDFKNGISLRYDGVFINKIGEELSRIPPEYEPNYEYINDDEQYSYGMAVVHAGDYRAGVVSISGELLANIEFDEVRIIGDKLIAVKINELWGIMRIDG